MKKITLKGGIADGSVIYVSEKCASLFVMDVNSHEGSKYELSPNASVEDYLKQDMSRVTTWVCTGGTFPSSNTWPQKLETR